MIFNRSLVLAADEIVGVRVLDRSGQVAVSVDGQLRGVLDPGDWVAVYAAPWRACLVRLHPSDFFGRLRIASPSRTRPRRSPTTAARRWTTGRRAVPSDLRHLHVPDEEK